MSASDEDVQELMFSLTRISDNLRRARERAMDPTRQAIMQQAATKGQVRPSEIAAELAVHQSSIARQTRVLEDAGLVSVVADPQDRRSCLISLTEAGWAEARRVTGEGLARFGEFVADWPAEDVRTLARLLGRLEKSSAEVKARGRGATGRRWQRQNQDTKNSE
ncbi:MAG TPA: MarR family winged helix-turn-helix transcriptional regulator [Pseudonocardiaceae bacterium]|nr:MarR family winged helix-turn-helix transcriptional regulator [Pseudonocardiaceae bacterium]